MASPLERRAAWVALALLLLLHLDVFWRAQRPELVLGWLPHDLAYRLGWMALAWAWLLWFTSRLWSEVEE